MLQFRNICLNMSATVQSETEVLNALGRLMNDSQESCSADFECSCPELDDLTRLARGAGALGSRLTGLLTVLLICTVADLTSGVGAGWGGCTVSLVREEQVEAFIKQIRETYEAYKDLDEEALDEAIFSTKPGQGACGTYIPAPPNHRPLIIFLQVFEFE